jgi:hypothetical protein
MVCWSTEALLVLLGQGLADHLHITTGTSCKLEAMQEHEYLQMNKCTFSFSSMWEAAHFEYSSDLCLWAFCMFCNRYALAVKPSSQTARTYVTVKRAYTSSAWSIMELIRSCLQGVVKTQQQQSLAPVMQRRVKLECLFSSRAAGIAGMPHCSGSSTCPKTWCS